jgi:amino acid transporter
VISATSTIFNVMVFASIFVLRRRFPDAERPYRAWLYPWSLIIILVVYSAFFVITLITALKASLIGLALTGTGAIYYYVKVAQPARKARGSEPTR